ncbi:hypothetical protein Nit79A3_1364 [Nitrosomonas sp. Is79A3]|uniref:hypothetical protein n=1 Tax=Nitrosomonas sp. (strain Is79A3) TaxID=261292 RepID=UPI000215CEE0
MAVSISNKKEAKKNDDCDHCSITDFTQKIKQEIGDKTVSLKVVAVSVFGSSYSEPVEYRLRYRYAVVSALGSSGYTPQDNEHIKYSNLNTGLSPEYCINTEITLPYEWYAHNSRSEKVLVIWLNEDKIPEGKYRDFIFLLYQNLKNTESKVEQFSFSLIGPTNTSLLIELMNSKSIEENVEKLHSFRIFSPGATISNKELVGALENDINQTCSDKAGEVKIQCLLDERSIVRTIGQDRNLAKALLWELEQRDVNRKIPIIKEDCKDQLVLISEQDSLYARSLVDHFSSLLKKQCKGGKELIKNFTYLRGLDGKLPEFDESNKKSQSEKNTKEQKNLLTQLDDASPEHAEGRNQFDYLRRLIDKIEQLDSADGNRDQIKAIGIIGTDVYDKLLILHALKDSFKHKIFFTTDLDARFLHKDQSAWARNLVIASNFDFSLHPKLQDKVMPFRDSYQTSTYLATLVALNPQVIEEWPTPDNNNCQSKITLSNKFNALLAPQIFEIGRTQAIHLASPTNEFLDKWIQNSTLKFTESSEIDNSNCLVNHFMECKTTIEPVRTKQIDWPVICVTLILLLFAAYLSWGFFKSGWKNVTPVQIVFILLPVSALLFLLFFLIYEDNYPAHTYGEPFLLLEGISVWPNLVIRFAGIMMMILLFIYFFHPRRGREIKAIEKNFKQCKEETCFRRWKEAVIQGPFLHFSKEKNTDEKSFDIAVLWCEYKKIIQYKESKGYLWIFLTSTISLTLTLYAFWGLGYLNFPARGVITLYGHYILVTLQFFILWGLVFWVAYEAIACKQFIESIEWDQTNSDKTVWSSEMRKQQSIMTGISISKLDPYLHFVLITKLVNSINNLIYLPFILMLIIAIGRSNLFDNLGFSLALIVVYLLASVYLITILFLLRKSAEKQCGMVLKYYEDYRMRLVAIASSELSKADNLLTEIRNVKKSTFLPIVQRPALLALLLPGGGIGLTSIIEYLYN